MSEETSTNASFSSSSCIDAGSETTSLDTPAPALSLPPFYDYVDRSREPDDDPLSPLVPPGHIPTFPAKFHAILSTPELSGIVSWMPHGRSWKVLKQDEFEQNVMPRFWKTAKFLTLIRQSKGWGFRRISKGRDKNSYYHEYFLRGLPHLSKKMRRPSKPDRVRTNRSCEPDFYAISKIYPVPDRAGGFDEMMLQCTLQGGGGTRMPVHYGVMPSQTTAGDDLLESDDSEPSKEQTNEVNPFQDQQAWCNPKAHNLEVVTSSMGPSCAQGLRSTATSSLCSSLSFAEGSTSIPRSSSCSSFAEGPRSAETSSLCSSFAEFSRSTEEDPGVGAASMPRHYGVMPSQAISAGEFFLDHEINSNEWNAYAQQVIDGECCNEDMFLCDLERLDSEGFFQ